MTDEDVLQVLTKEMSQVKRDLTKLNDSILKTFFFHEIYLNTVTAKDAHKNRNLVSTYRKKNWTATMETADGDVDEAYDIYTKDAFFC